MPISFDILEGCKKNNSVCQQQVYNHYYGYMLAIGYRYITDTNDAKMLINESFFKAFTKIEQYNDSMPFEIWIRRIMINTCIDFLRKNKKEKFNIAVNEENLSVHTNASINYAEINIESEHLIALMQHVPNTSRKVFYLFAIEGYSHKEIAELLDINEGTSKWHVNNARKILKEQLGELVKKNKTISITKEVLNY